MSAIAVTVAGFTARHGFFTRAGGVSSGDYASLNCSVSSADDPGLVAQNRALVAEAMGVDRLLGLTQVHGADVITALLGTETGARADAMVTKLQGIGLGVITADCAPVLFADAGAGVIGAAHAGWRGAVGGVLEATLQAMRALGAARIVAAIGPCIAQNSYEVGPELREAVEIRHRNFFRPGEAGRFWFDLAGYCEIKLREAGAAQVVREGSDTFADERFWSHRRRTLRGGGSIGHQISVITQ